MNVSEVYASKCWNAQVSIILKKTYGHYMIVTVLFAPPNVYLSILVITGVYGKNSKWNQTAPLAVINGPLKECSSSHFPWWNMFAFPLYLVKHVCLLTFLTETCLPYPFPYWNVFSCFLCWSMFVVSLSLLKNVCRLTSLAETCIAFLAPRLDGVSQDQFPISICPSSPFLPSQVLNGQYHSVTFLFCLSLYILPLSQLDLFQSRRWRPHIPLPQWCLSAFIPSVFMDQAI